MEDRRAVVDGIPELKYYRTFLNACVGSVVNQIHERGQDAPK